MMGTFLLFRAKKGKKMCSRTSILRHIPFLSLSLPPGERLPGQPCGKRDCNSARPCYNREKSGEPRSPAQRDGQRGPAAAAAGPFSAPASSFRLPCRAGRRSTGKTGKNRKRIDFFPGLCYSGYILLTLYVYRRKNENPRAGGLRGKKQPTEKEEKHETTAIPCHGRSSDAVPGRLLQQQ